MLIILSLLCILAGGILSICSFIFWIRKNSHRTLKYIALGLFLAGVELLFAGSGLPVGQLVLLNGILLCFCGCMAAFLWLICCICRKNRRWAKYAVWGLFLTGILCFVASGKLEERRLNQERAGGEIHEVASTQTTYDFEIKDGDTPLEISGYATFGHMTSVYDSQYLSMLFPDEHPTAEDCIRQIAQNADIPENFKAYFTDFVQRIEAKYPGMDYSILYQNLKTLRVEELETSEFMIKSMDASSCGVYRLDENAIYIPAGTAYVEGEWGFQVLIHEFCHAARSYRRKENDKDRKFASFHHIADEILNESMNSVFSCSLLNYEEKDIAYQVPSNYLRIMLECMDNYDVGDYMQTDDVYFLKKLDEYTGYTNYAEVIWKLISLQRNDWMEDRIDLSTETYDPIDDYLCELYYPLHITEDMSPEEKRAVADELIEKAFYDAPEDYKIHKQRFYDNLKIYT